ncbi:MAG: VanZ family protein [Fibrobacterota bacterium]
MTDRITRTLTALLFLFIIWLIIKADAGTPSLLQRQAELLPYGDKGGHFLTFGVLSLCVTLSFRFRTVGLGPVQIYAGSVAVFLFSCLEEFSQLLCAERTFDTGDILANFLGIAFFSTVARWAKTVLSRREKVRRV